MTSHEAREVLLRYRPGSADEEDFEVRAALELAARDPELAQWLDDHRKFQRNVQEGLRSMPVPEGLREQILSEKRVRLSVWRSPGRLALGALAALLLALGFAYYAMRDVDDESRFATYRSRMVKTALRGYAMDIETSDPAQIRDYLEAQRAPSDWPASPGLDATPLMGCAVLKWRNQPASLICYGKGQQPDLWLFVVDSGSVPDPPPASDLFIEKVNRLNTVSWTRDGQTYVLAGEKDNAELRGLLDGS